MKITLLFAIPPAEPQTIFFIHTTPFTLCWRCEHSLTLSPNSFVWKHLYPELLDNLSNFLPFEIFVPNKLEKLKRRKCENYFSISLRGYHRLQIRLQLQSFLLPLLHFFPLLVGFEPTTFLSATEDASTRPSLPTYKMNDFYYI